MICTNTIEYNKLVRDRIPEIIQAKGDVCVVRTLDDDEYRMRLKMKLMEEVMEYQESGSLEELADIYEVIRAWPRPRAFAPRSWKPCVRKRRSITENLTGGLFLIRVDQA